MRTLRQAPHRVNLNRPEPDAKRVKVGDALARLTEAGLEQVGADDLEIYRLVLSPAEFKRLEHRLARAVAEHWKQQNHSTWTDVEIPFGADLAGEVKQEQLRAWGHRPAGEPLPRSWTRHGEFDVPGRLKLLSGREFSVWGFRGRLLFRHAITTDAGEVWVDGWDEDGACRSISPERIRIVHRKPSRRSLRERLS